MNEQKELWEKLAKKNSKYYINSDHGKGISEEEFRKSGKEDYFKYIDSDPMIPDKGHLLEIGCGTGRMTEFMKDYIVTGIDISGEMIKQAKRRLRKLSRISFMETDGYTIPLPSNHFDIVFSYIVFQHFKTQEMVESNFREVYRVLEPGGIFKVRVRTDKIDSMNPWWAGVNFEEREGYSEAAEMASRIGFEILKTKKVRHYGLWLWLQK